MNKILLFSALSAFFSLPILAQEQTSSPKDSADIAPIEAVNEEMEADSAAVYDTENEEYAEEPTDYYTNDSTEVLLDENNVTGAYTPSTIGPNRKWHNQIFFQLGFMADNPNEGAKIRYGLATQWGVGFRTKRRLNNTFSVTNEWGYRAVVFNLKQEAAKVVPNNYQHRTEKIDFHSITTSLHLRINVGKRGNYIGNFLELGGYGGYALVTRHLTWDKLENSPAKTTKVVEKGLDYVNRLDYGLSGKIGHNHWSLFARYRLSDIFKDNKYPEMSKLTIGVDLGL